MMIYERTLAEIDDQLEGWAKVEALHVKKEAKFIKTEVKEEIDGGVEAAGGGAAAAAAAAAADSSNTDVKVKVEPEEEMDILKNERDSSDDDDYDDEEEDDDEDDFDELLDWRSKGT